MLKINQLGHSTRKPHWFVEGDVFSAGGNPPMGSFGAYLMEVWSSSEPLAVQLAQGLDLAIPCASLSGGEWMSARLAKVLSVPVDYFILDEPTNNLDLQSVEILKAALLNFKGAILVVTHDEDFANEVAITEHFHII